MVESGYPAGDGLVRRDLVVGVDLDACLDADSPVAAGVIELHAGGMDARDGLDGGAIVPERRSTGAAQEDVGQRGVLVGVGAVVDEQAHRPRRSRLVVVVCADHHRLSAGEVEGAGMASRDQPGECEVAHAESRPSTGATADLAARADRQTAARFEVGACHRPRQRRDQNHHCQGE